MRPAPRTHLHALLPMIRSPLFYPLARSLDSEAGGAADLQADVMRFMAILSLCLMAIFALMQSLPPEPVVAATSAPVRPEPEPGPEAEAEAKPTTEVKPKADIHPQTRQSGASVTKVVEFRPPPVSKPLTQATANPPVQAVKAPTPPATPVRAVPPSDSTAGFTFRFASDRALTELVARNEVGLYAISNGQALRMTLNRDQVEFWSASLPKQYHEMDSSTVPESVVDALQLTHGGIKPGTRWGVTLPSKMSAKLRQLMRDNHSGALIIGVDGDLRLEP